MFDAAPNTSEGVRLEVLTTLIEAYEEQKYHIPSPDPVEAILYYLESRGLSRDDVEEYLGSREDVDEVLSRKRSLSIEVIRRLRFGLGISADIFIQPYSLAA